MADKIEIELLFTPDGEVRLETRGLKGKTCMEETESLERAIGTVKDREKTSEYYQQHTAVKGTTRQG
ncbi:MAG: DUF2997 domain-containing protein [Anaeromyxobacteraceae bacterium]